MALRLTTIAKGIYAALDGETDFDAFDKWWGPPRLALDVARNDTYIRFDQLDEGTFTTDYRFEIKFISRGGVDSNSPDALEDLWLALVALFNGTTIAGMTATILTDIVARVQDQTTYTLTVKFT